MARFSAAVSERRRAAQAAIISYLPGFLISAAVIFLPLATLSSVRQRDDASRVPQPQSQVTEKLGKPRQLDKGVRWKRDPATGELITSYAPAGGGGPSDSAVPKLPRGAIIQTVEIVPISCSVFAPDGAPLRDLVAKNFRVYDDDVERPIAFFDAGARNVPEHVAVVIDASPSVLPETADMKQAAMALVDGLAPTAQVAVADFSAHTYLQTGFTGERDVLRKAVDRVDVRQLLGDTGGSNIYEAVYLTAHELFHAVRGRKAIVLLTDGQDSGLGLTLSPATALPRGRADDRLTFDDVARELEAEGIELFAVSTETRPKILTREWLAAHREATFLTQDDRKTGIPAYTLYLAEMVRRSAGDLYFLHESATLAAAFGQIAERVGEEYTLGVPPAPGNAGGVEANAPRPGWHKLRVEIVGAADAKVIHREAYYVAAQPGSSEIRALPESVIQ
jgi:VWFA-related protein